MFTQKISLILVLALLLNGAYVSVKKVSSYMAASAGDVVQPLPAAPSPITSPSQAEVSSPTVQSAVPTEREAVKPVDSDSDFNPETSFPLAPNTQWDPGNGNSGEVESSGAFSLHSRASVETLNQFYQAALPKQGWKLRYIDANQAGGVTQYWKQDMAYMSVDFSYDNSGLAIQSQWHLVDLEAVKMLPEDVSLPDQAYFVEATETTWQVYIPQNVEAVSGYYQQKAAALNWKPGSVPNKTDEICGSDCGTPSTPGNLPGVTPAPTLDPRQPKALVYTMADGNEISLEFHSHQDATILDLTLTLKNVESAGLPKDMQIYPGATVMVIAPGMVRFTAPSDLKTTVQFYTQTLSDTGWKPFAGYSLDTPQLYFQEWDKGEQAVRLHISAPGSASQSSTVSIQCVECTAP